MFRQRVKHYHQWLSSSIHLKTKFSQSSPDLIRLQSPSKRTSSGLLCAVSSVKQRNRKGGKCNISWVLQSPVSSPQASGFDPTTQVKTCFDCKMFDVTNWVACLNKENGPGGTPSHETLSVSPQGALEISSVIGQPPSLDRNHFSTPRVVAESHKRDERCRSSPQRPQYPTLYRRLKQRLGRSLRASLYKGSVVRQGKKATHKCSRKRFLWPFKVSRTSAKTKQCWLLQTTQQ